MSHPLFRSEVEVFQADIRYRDFHAGDTLDFAARSRPDGAARSSRRSDRLSPGLRRESFAYLTDNEIRRSGRPATRRAGARADLAVYDCTYATARSIQNRDGVIRAGGRA
jgi:hypothetical protein